MLEDPIIMYWLINIWYNNKGRTYDNDRLYNWHSYQGRTCHIIRAKSKKDALRIREKYGISYPMNSDRVKTIECHKIDTRRKENKMRLWARRHHWGGSIWYEKDSELKTEEWKEQKG